MTNKEIARELREHALYSEWAFFADLWDREAFNATLLGREWGDVFGDDQERRMYLFFIAERLS